MTWWNDQAWIASRNIARATARDTRIPLDVDYLEMLSPDATPTLVAALPTLPDSVRRELTTSIAGWNAPTDDPWYAWNYRRARAQAASRALPRPGSTQALREVTH